MDFLYFPDDKTEYIPSIIILIIFSIGAVLTMYIIMKVSKKEQKKSDEKYQPQKISDDHPDHK